MSQQFRGAITVSYYKKLSFVTAIRYVTSLFFYFDKQPKLNLSVRHVVIIYDLLMKLQDLSDRDPSFRNKYGYSLKRLAIVLKKTKITTNKDLKTVSKMINIRIKQDKRLRDDFVYPSRNVGGLRQKMEQQMKVNFSNQTAVGTKKSQVRPKQILGKGYTDKGSSRNVAVDGSPHWTEAASDKRINPPESYYDEKD